MAHERIGKYVIGEMLGQGGMGAVMLARDPDLDREVALKLIMPHRLRLPQARERFLREARAMARLSDPHIVKVYAFEPDADPPYLVMERVHGEDLKHLLQRTGPLTPAMVRDCAWQCLRGLAAAHAAGIVHRDIKPSNIMLCSDGIYKLLDFGLAASHEGDLTDSGEVVGTLRFIAPERMLGAPATPTSDLWALGVVLCELATGRQVFPQGRAQLDPLALPPGQPPDVSALILRLLAADPGQRPLDATQALGMLGGAVPVAGPAPSTSALPMRPALRDSGTTRAVVAATHRPAPTIEPSSEVAIQRVRLPFWLKLTASIWLVASLGAVVAGYSITERAVATQYATLKRQLQGIAVAASQLVDPQQHRRMVADPVGQVEELAALRRRLAGFAAAFPEVRFIYTMAPLPETPETGVVQFVCDASNERDLDGDGVIGPDEAQAVPGQRYPAKDSPDLLNGFTRTAVDGMLTSDQWGTWTSGYAPLLMPDGTSTGLVGIDIPADHLAVLRREFIWHSVILLGTTLVAFLAAGLLIAWRMRRPVAELSRGMRAVADGDLSVEIFVSSQDEFGVLASSFRRMRNELRRAAQRRDAFDAFITRAFARHGGQDGIASGDGARLAIAISDGQQAALTAVLDAARSHGGDPELVEAGCVCLLFPSSHPGDLPQERAVRCALAALTTASGPGWACGVAVGGPEAVGRAAELARAGLRSGTDLMVDAPAYTAIAAGFFADHVHEHDTGSGHLIEHAWAVKAAVSGGKLQH